MASIEELGSVKPASGPVDIVKHFPPLPITKREASPAPSYISSNSEESVCSVRPVAPMMTLNDALRNPSFKIRLTLSKDTTCFRYCDDRLNNLETELSAGTEVLVKDVREFPEVGANWYHIIRPAFGWIDGEALRKTPARRAVQTKKRKAIAKKVAVVPEAEKFPFAFGETVKCFVNDAWRIGTIQSTSVPVKVLLKGETKSTIVDVSNILKIQSKQKFTVLVKKLAVRADPNVKSFAKTHLTKGTEIHVVEFSGQFAKLNNPIGWVRCRNDFQLSIVESNYVPENMLPTLRIKNLSADVHSKVVVQCLKSQFDEGVYPFFFAGVRVDFTETKRNGKKDALVAFPEKWKAETVLKHSLAKGFTISGQGKLDLAFDFAYLRSASIPKNWRPQETTI